MSKCASKARMFIGTLNNPDLTVVEDYLKLWHTKAGAVYVCGQLERGEEGTPHIQYFIQFAEQKRISGLKRHCPKSHFEPVGVNNGADDYCNKEETRVEGTEPYQFGTKPARLNKKGDKARKTKELLAMGPEAALEQGLVGLGK